MQDSCIFGDTFRCMDRPPIFSIQTAEELNRWYWTKQELIGLCRHVSISSSGSKEEMLTRLSATFNGNNNSVAHTTDKKTKSLPRTEHAFVYALDTILSPAYKNGREARRFFQEQCGTGFRFSIPLLAFIKKSTGKTLRDVVNEWHRLDAIKKSPGYKSTLPPGLQYNQYIRDFFADNPGTTLADARACWNKKRQLPLGKFVYERSDWLL